MSECRWADVRGIPNPVALALDSLRFGHDASSPDSDEALDFLDRNQLTLVFGHTCDPPALRERIQRSLNGNCLRLERLRREYERIASALDSIGVPHTVLKGFSHDRGFVPDPNLRCHYDLDLLVEPDHLEAAHKAIAALGFETPHSQEGRPIDHAAPMVRKSDWQWRGDYFDPEIPAVVELHYRTWDPETEGFAIPNPDPQDRFGYAAAHALRHLLRGNLKVFHIYELAYSLETGTTTVEVGIHQAIICNLARKWFSCRIPSAAESIPGPVHAWLDRYWASPVLAQFKPNKDELWLHLELVADRTVSRQIIQRRLFPVRLPDPLHGTSQPTGSRIRRTVDYSAFVAKRAGFHSLSLLKLAFGALSWRTTRAIKRSRR